MGNPHRSKQADVPEMQVLVNEHVARLTGEVAILGALPTSGETESLRHAARPLKGSGGARGFAPSPEFAAVFDRSISHTVAPDRIRTEIDDLVGSIRNIRGHDVSLEAPAALPRRPAARAEAERG